MNYFAGIDIGSTTIKLVLINDQEETVARLAVPTGCHFHQNSLESFQRLLQQAKVERDQVAMIQATGYGRKLFKEADDTISEISANGVGGAKTLAERPIRTIINIGGQDLKVIKLDEDGHVDHFLMNDKCAAGTGRFLEMTARNLELEVSELGELHHDFTGIPAIINATCTVFAESEIIGLLADGREKNELIAGVHHAIAKRVTRLVKRLGLEGDILFDGGPALNSGLVKALEIELMHALVIPAYPQFTTAYGAALIGRESWCFEQETAVTAGHQLCPAL